MKKGRLRAALFLCSADGDFNFVHMKHALLFIGLAAAGMGRAQSPFAPAQHLIERMNGPMHQVVVDLDQDGDLDVVFAARNDDELVAFRQEGPGIFGERETWLAPTADVPLAQLMELQAGDWDGDGLLDLIWCDQSAGQIAVLPASGTAPYVIAEAASAFACTLGDLNGDGALDLAYVTNYGNAVGAVFGDGSGGISAAYGPETLAQPFAVAIGDSDGDGANEVVIGTRSQGKVYRWQPAAGTPPEQLADWANVSALAWDTLAATPRWWAATDNAYLLVTDDPVGEAAVWDTVWTGGAVEGITPYPGGAAFAAPQAQHVGRVTGTSGDWDVALTGVPGAVDVDVADLDGDGAWDAVASSQPRHRAAWFADVDAAGFDQPIEFIHPLQYVRNMDFGDLEGDGDLDAVLMVQGPNLYDGGPEMLHVVRREADGSVSQTATPTGTYFGRDVALADANGDGFLDAAVTDYNGDRVVLLAGGAEGLQLADTIIPDLNRAKSLAWGDVDGDGDPDLVTVAWSSQVAVSLNEGGTLAPEFYLPAGGNRGEAVVLEDFNGDGAYDIAVAYSSGQEVRVWLGPDFGAPDTVGGLGALLALGAADADGDGDLDLYAPAYGADSVTVLVNDGLGGFAIGAGTGPMGLSGAVGVDVADADGDGLPEVVVADASLEALVIWQAATDSAWVVPVGGDGQDAAWVDWDADGDLDAAGSVYSGVSGLMWLELAGEWPEAVPGCLGDLNGDQTVNISDFTLFLGAYGCMADCGPADLNGDAKVSVQDALMFLLHFSRSCAEING